MTDRLAHPRLTEDTASELIASMEDRSDLLDAETWTPHGGFESFFAEFVRLRSDAQTEIVAKFGRGWTAADVEFVSAEIACVRRLFSELPSGSVDVPPSLGWSADPACIALPFVVGDNLFDVLADRSHPLHRESRRLDAILTGAGEALGAYHASEVVPENDNVRRTTRGDMIAAARRAGFRRKLVDQIETEIPVVRGYRLSSNDFTIGEITDASATGLVILDPPHVRKFDHVHRDLSAFTLALHRVWFGERVAEREDPTRGRFDELRSGFLDGYRTTAPHAIDEPIDRWLLSFYELSRIGSQLSGRIRGRQFGQVQTSLRWWVRHRRTLGSPPLP